MTTHENVLSHSHGKLPENINTRLIASSICHSAYILHLKFSILKSFWKKVLIQKANAITINAIEKLSTIGKRIGKHGRSDIGLFATSTFIGVLTRYRIGNSKIEYQIFHL